MSIYGSASIATGPTSSNASEITGDNPNQTLLFGEVGAVDSVDDTVEVVDLGTDNQDERMDETDNVDVIDEDDLDIDQIND